MKIKQDLQKLLTFLGVFKLKIIKARSRQLQIVVVSDRFIGLNSDRREGLVYSKIKDYSLSDLSTYDIILSLVTNDEFDRKSRLGF